MMLNRENANAHPEIARAFEQYTKDTVEQVVKGLAVKAEENSEATEQMSAFTEEQLATMNEMSNIISELILSVETLNSEISIFKTEKNEE